MIPIIDEPPRLEVLEQLQIWCRELRSINDYGMRVAQAKLWFETRNREANPTFRAVRAALRNMSSGAWRCHYCEDSLGSQVEHVRPKSLYPEHAFYWENYVLSCQSCNSSKLAKYAVIVSGELVQVSRRRGDPIIEPPDGDMAMLDPRTNEPTLLELDLQDTFRIVPRPELDALARLRVDYTINRVLRLNEGPHPERRGDAYADYRIGLREYVDWGRRGASEIQLRGLRARLARRDHVMVWREIQRQSQLSNPPPCLRADFGELFDATPEALRW